MRLRIVRRVLVAIAVLASVSGPAPALASTTPTLSLNQSAGKAAGSTANLGVDLKFADTGTDSPHHLTIELPPGLLANASINGGSCLKTVHLTGSTCEIGTGTVTATADPIPGILNLPLAVPVAVTFYLVPPPAAGDLAGLAVVGLGEQIGSTGDIKIRPSGDPDGVGVTIVLSLPNQLPLTLPLIGQVNLVQISLTEINSTFNALRYPTTCPSPAAKLIASADSYSDPTIHTVSAPLPVTGCASLPYAPSFKVSAARDSSDSQVRLLTTITQAASEAPSRSVSLAFPNATLAPNLASIRTLCLNLASGTCTPIGSATAASPLYPQPLTGTAFLTGSAAGLALTLVFPSPFPLTLAGAVDLVNNSATFTGLPDIPLTALAVSLNGGPDGLFLSTCQAPSGTATATLTDQNGDRTVHAPASFTVVGCPGSGAGTSVGGSTPTSPGGAVAPTTTTTAGVTVSATAPSGQRGGRTGVSFKLVVSKRAARLRALTLELPAGMSFVLHHVGRKLAVTGVMLSGARAASMRLLHGRLLITLRRPASALTIRMAPSAVRESSAVRARIRAGTLRRVILTVITENTRQRHVTFRIPVSAAAL